MQNSFKIFNYRNNDYIELDNNNKLHFVNIKYNIYKKKKTIRYEK